MNIKYNILPLFAAVSLLTACSDDDIDRVYTVGEAENTLILRAGVSEDGAGVVTRAGDENHTKHVAFTSGTQIALRVDGTWTGHSPSSDIKQKTVATLGGASDKHNALSTYDPVLFWDDYGTADPANKETGRAQGLTIYGAAVDGKTSLPTTLSGLDNTQSTWTSLPWQVCSESMPSEIDQTSGWSGYDLVTSNNVVYSSTLANDNAYKFADRSAGKLLEFTHAMTKITVQLTAGEGFPRTDEANAETAHFEAAPSVTLEGFYYKGTVDVEAKTSTPITTATANVKMHGGAAAHIATFDALVFPGNTFSATIAKDDKFTPTSSNNILELNADGNIYKVTAAQLVKAIVGTSKTGEEVQGTLEQGKNYILNITVKKTDLDITATILDWKTVEADEDTPKINVTAEYGQKGTAFTKDYDFFRSLNIVAGYDEDADTNGINYAARYTASSSVWSKTLYWPNHQTHYFFRGVYPVTGSTACPSSYSNESVQTVEGKDVIPVTNVLYTPNTYPSDLAIGFPRGTSVDSFDETCKVDAHKDSNGKYPDGICATEGLIHMNFKYCMSQVKVQLKTTDGEDKVNIGSNTAAVEIIDCYNNAYIKLEDGKVASKSEEVRGNHAMTQVAVTTDEAPILARFHDAIIPQNLSETVGSETKQMKFRITVTNTDGTTDVYECIIQNIQVEEGGEKNDITEWEAGKCYVYTLTLKKTAINVTATLTDWVEVTANDEVWF